MAYDYKGNEVDELLDLVMADGSIHDLDQYDPQHMQTTSGSTFAWILHRVQNAEAALKRLYEATNPSHYDAYELRQARGNAERVLASISDRAKG